MITKDDQGKFELRLDLQRGIVFEKYEGAFSESDIERLHQVYVTKIAPVLKGKKWVKCSDLRNYKVSNVVDSGNQHIKWCTENGFAGGAIVLDSTVVKMQMNRITKGLGVEPVPFDSMEKADAWLKTQGF